MPNTLDSSPSLLESSIFATLFHEAGYTCTARASCDNITLLPPSGYNTTSSKCYYSILFLLHVVLYATILLQFQCTEKCIGTVVTVSIVCHTCFISFSLKSEARILKFIHSVY